MKCENTECNNLVKFDKSHHPKKYCEYCNRKKGTQENKDGFSKKYWEIYIQQNFNILTDIEINKNLLIIKKYCEHYNIIEITKEFLKKIKNTGIHDICIDCNKEYYSKLEINDNTFKENWESIKTVSENKLIFYKPYIWALINKKMKEKNVNFIEAKYMLYHNIENKPKCLICNNEVKFSKDAYGYLLHCDKHLFSYYSSKGELDIVDFIKNNHIEIIQNNRKLISKELDIYVPSKYLAIEFNGTYWHGDNIITNKNYHYNKWKECKEKGIKLLTVWEDDWNNINKKEILKSIILNECNLIKNKIGARESDIKLIENKEKTKFLECNHLQGNCQSSINLGLYYNNELISLMTFGKKRKMLGSSHTIDQYELLRFCSKINYQIMGAASKLFKYFIINFNPKNVISYASCDISNGNLYEKLGFKYCKYTGVNYWWVKNGIKYHRSNFMKHKLIKDGANYNKTENEIMIEKGYNKIYGTGNLKYEWVNI